MPNEAPDPIAQMPVTAVVARRPWPGREQELLVWAQTFVDEARRFAGFVESHIFEPRPPDKDLVIAMTFANADALTNWERSPERARMREAARPLVHGLPRAKSPSALTGLFGDGSRVPVTPPRRWKTATVIMLAVYPFTVLLQVMVSSHIAQWPVLLRALPTSIVMPAYVTWLGAPVLSRALRGWLQR